MPAVEFPSGLAYEGDALLDGSLLGHVWTVRDYQSRVRVYQTVPERPSASHTHTRTPVMRFPYTAILLSVCSMGTLSGSAMERTLPDIYFGAQTISAIM